MEEFAKCRGGGRVMLKGRAEVGCKCGLYFGGCESVGLAPRM